jgi:predicted Zn-dependent protease
MSTHRLIFVLLPVLLCTPWIKADDLAAEIQRHKNQARLALARNDLKGAEQEYQAVLKLDPKNAAVYAALGVALYGSGRPADAASALPLCPKTQTRHIRGRGIVSLRAR